MYELSARVGKTNAISMVELYRRVFGREPRNKINDTRQLRRLIEDMRNEGSPICSSKTPEGGGYYLAAAGSELNDYCKKVRKQALKALAMEAGLRKITLPKLINEISINLEGVDIE
jgi:hypothetical protein